MDGGKIGGKKYIRLIRTRDSSLQSKEGLAFEDRFPGLIMLFIAFGVC